MKYLVSENMEWLLGRLGDDALYFLLLNSIVIIKHQNQYWQMSGRSLELFFEEMKKGPKSDLVPHNEPYSKAGLPKQKQQGPKIREYFKEFINRNHMLYCLHSNKKPTLFYKNKLSMLAKRAEKIHQDASFTPHERRLCLLDLGREMREYIFMERGIEDRECARAFDEAAADWVVRFSHTDVERIYKQTCKIDKSFFSLKNEIKLFIKLKEHDDKKISDFISRLVKLDTPVHDVNRFVVECVRKMLPEKLFGKKNKEYLVGQVSECVKMKKYEMLSFKEVYKRVDSNESAYI